MKILLAIDGSPSAQAAVEAVARMPLSGPVDITIVTVLPLITYFRTDMIQTTSPEWAQRKKAAQAGLDSAAQHLRQTAPHVDTTLREGNDEAEVILAVADELGIDIIVLGSEGQSAIKRFLVGSVARRVTAHANCSVWVVRSPAATARQA